MEPLTSPAAGRPPLIRHRHQHHPARRGAGALLWLTLACGLPLQAQAQPFTARFSPADGVVPSATNLLFSGSTDGTLNIPVTDAAAAPLVEALNALDGFSTTVPLTTTFSDPIDPASVNAGDSVRVFEVDLVNPFLEPDADAPFAVDGVRRELNSGDFLATVVGDGSTLAVVPLRPLRPKTGYMVVLTDGIRSSAGDEAVPDLTYIFARYRHGPLVDGAGRSRFRQLQDAQAQQLEQIRRLVVSQEDAADDAGVERGSIVLSWSLLTQSVGDALEAVDAQATAQPLQLASTGATTAAFNAALPGLADVYAGTFQVPYYLEAPTAVPAVILGTQWRGENGAELTRYNPTPVATQNLTVPLLATAPNSAGKPATGWPVVIFQHGITRNRVDLIAVADTLAAAGLAALAIDLPLHGVTDPASPLYQTNRERTFNVDLRDNATGAAGADGRIDDSGEHFLNLASLLTARDNLRQGAADLLHLRASLADVDLDGDGQGDLDLTRVGFLGHSLGGMVGGVFLGIERTVVNAATLSVAGGGIARLLQASESFGPPIAASLQASGIEPGSVESERFFAVAQQVIDAGDPVNYAEAAADYHPIYLPEVLGDATIPNAVAGAPLSGSEGLARALGLTTIGQSAQNPDGLRVLVRFTEGSHSTLLSPADSPAVYLEMQAQIAAFLASEGGVLPVDNAAVVQQP